MLRDVQNFEVSPTGGYTRVGGYERFDGRTKPSTATYTIVQVSTFLTVPSTGQTLTGSSPGATGIIIAIVNSTDKYLVLARTTGAFTDTEVVQVGATTIGTAIPQTVSLTAQANAQYLNLAADELRALIGTVPGSGPVRGVVHAVFSDVDHTYAFRDNSGATATILYESSTSGWTAIPFHHEVSFTAGGTATPADAETLTQGGVTATIQRVVLQSGAWTGTAAGRFIVSTPVGGNFAAGAATCSGGATLTLSGVQTAITLLPGGTFEFERANFSGSLGSRRLYGCDNVNRGFEFDGTVFVPLTTGTSLDVPTHVCEHKNHLFFAFQTSVIHSAPGAPYNWTASSGASEIAVSDTVTGIKRLAGSQTTATLEIACLESTHVLYGTGVSTWNRVMFKEGVGAAHYSLQNLGRMYAMDAHGVVDLYAAQEYGNFQQTTLTFPIQTFIDDKRSRVAYSSVCRSKSQYRVFFTDGTALYMTLVNGKLMGSTQVVFPLALSCAHSSQLANGNEIMFAGSATGGYVYEMDQGSSFDGDAIEAYLTFNWNSMKSPRLLKEFFKAALDIQGNFYAAFTFAYALAYGDSTEQPQPSSADYESNLGSQAYWDAVNWDEFNWDGLTLIPSEVGLDGCAVNMQVRLSSSTDYIYPFTVTSMMTRWAKADQAR